MAKAKLINADSVAPIRLKKRGRDGGRVTSIPEGGRKPGKGRLRRRNVKT